MLSPLLKSIELDFARLDLYENYLVSTIKEGVIFGKNELTTFYQIFDSYYPGKPFGYISDRKFDYTVNPTCYLKSSQYPSLLAMAILCHNDKSFKTAQFERSFYERPMEAFYDKEQSVNWITNLVENKK
jgi:hypothetical protein